MSGNAIPLRASVNRPRFASGGAGRYPSGVTQTPIDDHPRGRASDLLATATAAYDDLRLDDLPPALRRNSLDYYYLSIYPSLKGMRPLGEADRPPYPETVRNVYIHVPFCSGVCDFCSYFLVAISPRKREAISRYMTLVEAELRAHARHTRLDIRYLFFGGGTPSLIPHEALARFLAFLRDEGHLNPAVMGTLELHPEFFADPAAAARFLRLLADYGINRVSVGYQVSDEQLLGDTHRRHGTRFLAGAMGLLRDHGFLVNLDLMYGLAGQSHAGWEATLRDAVAAGPDSVATYFLFVDRGTRTHDLVARGRVTLPDHRHAQTQHLMAQIFLEAAGYHELPNDFWARDVGDPGSFRPERLPSAAVTLPVGPGSYGHYGNTQLCNVFDLAEYERRISAGRSPLWRGHQFSAEQALHRDVMFALKNDPWLDCGLFRTHYNRSPLDVFAPTFERLVDLDLLTVAGDVVRLTRKGRLVVEEITCLFRHPAIQEAADGSEDGMVLEKHNFAPTYAASLW